MKALVVHARRTGLGLVRGLGKAGLKIYCADLYRAEAFYSKYCVKGFVIQNMLDLNTTEMIQQMINIAEEISDPGEKIFLVTGSDDYLLFFCNHWNSLENHFIPIFETDKRKLDQSLAKDKMYKLAVAANVPIPETSYSPVDSKEILHYPVIIKPSLKKTPKIDVVAQAFRIKKCANKEELDRAISQLYPLNVSYVVQQYIPGNDDTLYTSGIVSYQGSLCAIVNGRKLRQFPPMLGECALGELIDEPRLSEYAYRLMKEADITGICQIEFKKHNNNFYLMEINPRPWSWHGIAQAAGVNLPAIAVEVISTGVVKEIAVPKKKNISWMFPLIDLKYNVIRHRNISVFAWVKDIITSDSFAFWSWKDPLPIIPHLYFAIYYEYFLALRRKCKK